MMDATTLLISSEGTLIQLIEGAVASISHLSLRVAPRIEEADAFLYRDDLVLLLVHHVAETDITAITELLETIRATKRPVATLVLAERYQAEEVLAFLRAGAVDYLSRPLDLSRLTYLADSLTLRARLIPSRPAPAPEPFPIQYMGEQEPFLYAPSDCIGQLMEQVQRVAPQEATLLLTGETGTGKTRLARLIHEISPRRDEPFLVIHCGALSPNLMESEMFGHVKGAFTGADRDRNGKFADAGRGTLLLDEIDSLSVDLQTKLLRVVEERVFEPVGSNRTMAMRARLIVASNRDLEREVTQGRFRSDLYYRLNVVGFYLAPLRERRTETIPPLANHFLNECATRNGREVSGLAPEALEALQAYDWPGNVRELRNVVERAVAICANSEVGLEDLPHNIRKLYHGARETANTVVPGQVIRLDSLPHAVGVAGSSNGGELDGSGARIAAANSHATLAQTKEEAEIARITQALRRQKNNRLRAAAELGISRMALYKKLHRYGLMGAG
jgi:two-component system response regulator HydG